MRVAVIIVAICFAVFGLAIQVSAQQAPTVTIAPTNPALAPPKRAATDPAMYHYNTMRIITKDSVPACARGDWDCMTNLCKTELGPLAGRNNAGCWSVEGGNFMCIFECTIWRPTNE
jgi:hypothetical protein